jgi:hypothetical protein
LVVTTAGDEVFLDEMKAILHPPEDGASVATAEEALRAMALLRDCRSELGLSDKFE